MLRNRLLLQALLLYAVGKAQTLRMPASVDYTRLTAYSSQFSDAFSFSGNLGALGLKQVFSAGIYSERRFSLKELSSFSGALVLPSPSGNFGWKGDYFGNISYNESSVGLAYARELGSKVAVGVQFNYFSLKVAGYGKTSAVGFDAGAKFRLAPQLNAGIQVYNPVGTSWGAEGEERLPAVYTAGLGYDVSKQVFIGLEAEKTEDLPVGVNTGLHYAMAEKLVARTGIRSAAGLYYLGFGVRLKQFRLDAAVSFHPYLGTTPGLLLLYSSKE